MRLFHKLDDEAAPLWGQSPRDEQRLVTLYQPLVEKMAYRQSDKNPRVSYDEFVAAGLVALLECVRKFDPDNERQARFSTFAVWRVGFAFVEEVRSRDWVQPKVRDRFNKGELDLPAVSSLSPLDDAPVPESFDASGRLADVLANAEPLIRGLAVVAVDEDHDVDRIAGRLGTSSYLAGHIVKHVVGRLQETPVMV